jgi:hypothetical protein
LDSGPAPARLATGAGIVLINRCRGFAIVLNFETLCSGFGVVSVRQIGPAEP